MNGMTLDLKKYKNLTRWYELISKREAVQKGYDLFEKRKKFLAFNRQYKFFHLVHVFLELQLKE